MSIPIGGGFRRLVACAVLGHRFVRTAGGHYETCRRCAYTFPREPWPRETWEGRRILAEAAAKDLLARGELVLDSDTEAFWTPENQARLDARLSA